MKRISVLLFASFLGLLLWAQRSIIIYLGNVGKESIKISEVDTVRFKDGKILIEGKDEKAYNIADVDSATFDLGARDTVFITYQNSSVIIDNPYGEEGIETYTDAAHVTLVSHVGKKGSITNDFHFLIVADLIKHFEFFVSTDFKSETYACCEHYSDENSYWFK